MHKKRKHLEQSHSNNNNSQQQFIEKEKNPNFISTWLKNVGKYFLEKRITSPLCFGSDKGAEMKEIDCVMMEGDEISFLHLLN